MCFVYNVEKSELSSPVAFKVESFPSLSVSSRLSLRTGRAGLLTDERTDGKIGESVHLRVGLYSLRTLHLHPFCFSLLLYAVFKHKSRFFFLLLM